MSVLRRLIVLAVFAILATTGEAHADPAADCAFLAHKPTAGDMSGVNEADRIDIPRALEACGAAQRAAPNDAGITSNYGRALMAAKRYDEAIRYLEAASNGGNLQAIYLRAVAAAYGWGGVADPKAYVAGMTKASDGGYPPATYALGSLYAVGYSDIPKNYERAEAYLTRAASDGNGDAYAVLGNLVYDGHIEAEYRQTMAKSYWLKGFALGSVFAATRLAQFYYEESGVLSPGDFSVAENFLRFAVANGSFADRIRIAGNYETGIHAPFDPAAARRLYEDMLQVPWLDDNSKGAVNIAHIELLLADDNPASRERAYILLRDAANAGEGDAIAALAYPSTTLLTVAPGGQESIWRTKLDGIDKPFVILRAAWQLGNGGASQQNLGRSIELYERAGQLARGEGAAPFYMAQRADALAHAELYAPAIDQLARDVQSNAYLSAPSAWRDSLRTTSEATFANQWQKLDKSSIPSLTILANLGWPGAQTELAALMMDDPQLHDSPSTRRWLTQAADAGSIRAMRLLVDLDGSPLDRVHVQTTLALWKNAASGGDADAALALAHYYRGAYADGKPIDGQAAREWAVRATNLNSIEGRYVFAMLLFQGIGSDRDNEGAIRELRFLLLCDGYTPARVALGRAYLVGAGVPRDPKLARRWLILAGRSGDGDGAVAMLRAEALGWAMPVDESAARHWLIEARRLGSKEAAKWLESCGPQVSLACLKKQRDFDPGPIGIASLGAESPDDESQAASLRSSYEVAIERGTQAQAMTAFMKLRDFYLLYDKFDLLLPLMIRNNLIAESRDTSLRGSGEYSSLVRASCLWAQSSRFATLADKPEAALFLAKVAVNKLQEARRHIADLDPQLRECFLKQHGDRYRYLAGLLVDQGRITEAEQVLGMLKDFEFHNYLRDSADRGDSLRQIAMKDSETAALSAIDSTTRELLKASAARSEFAALVHAGQTPTDEQRKRYDSARAVVEHADVEFRAALLGLTERIAGLDRVAPNPNRAGTADIDQDMMRKVSEFGEKDVAAVQGFVEPNRVTWLITTRDFQQTISVEIDQVALRNKVEMYRAAVNGVDPNVVRYARELYSETFAKVDAVLRASGSKTILLSLDDSLRYIPFAALHDGKDWLVRRYDFVAFRKIADLHATKVDGGRWRVAGFGASRGGAGLSPLPGVKRELESIIRDDGGTGFLPGSIKLDDTFTRPSLSEAFAGGFSVVHLATHFRLDPSDGRQSFLLMGDGSRLNLAEIDKGAWRMINIDLLTLSACQTAIGSSEEMGGMGLESMAALVRHAGAGTVIASLWKVNDDSTADLMTQFYKAKSGSGVSSSRALQVAQINMIDSAGGRRAEGRSHPFYWAAFILSGNWE